MNISLESLVYQDENNSIHIGENTMKSFSTSKKFIQADHKSLSMLRIPQILTPIVLGLLLGACSDSNNNVSTPPVITPAPAPAPITFAPMLAVENNARSNALLSLNPGGPGGSPNQSLRAGDVLMGDEANNVLVGGLGVDILVGAAGDDILIGGTEDFNSSVDGDGLGSDNRDRAFGNAGDDVFIWAPGDGSDYFDGGDGTDVLIFGVVGESRDAAGGTDGAPFFAVNPPGTAGTMDHDGIFLDENGQPRVRSSNSPGFCTILDAVANRDDFASLNINHIVRFSLRGVADTFDAAGRTDDDGLRVAISLENTEFVVCTKRDFVSGAGVENIEVFDVSGEVPFAAELTDLPAYVQDLII